MTGGLPTSKSNPRPYSSARSAVNTRSRAASWNSCGVCVCVCVCWGVHVNMLVFVQKKKCVVWCGVVWCVKPGPCLQPSHMAPPSSPHPTPRSPHPVREVLLGGGVRAVAVRIAHPQHVPQALGAVLNLPSQVQACGGHHLQQ